MYSRLDDLIALVGLCCVLAGVFLWLGLAAALILTGAVLIFVGARLNPAQRAASNVPGERTSS